VENRNRIDTTSDEWIHEVSVRKSWKTGSACKAAIMEFRACCKKTLLDEIDRDDITAFVSWFRAKGNAARTGYNHLAFIRIFLRFAGFPDVLQGKDMPRYSEKAVSAYTREPVASDADGG
jgi:site-specific recombinase XerD